MRRLHDETQPGSRACDQVIELPSTLTLLMPDGEEVEYEVHVASPAVYAITGPCPGCYARMLPQKGSEAALRDARRVWHVDRAELRFVKGYLTASRFMVHGVCGQGNVIRNGWEWRRTA